MAKTETGKATTKVEAENAKLKKKVKDSTTKQKKLENELKELKEQMKLLKEQATVQVPENVQEEKVEDVLPEIPSNQRVKMIHMIYGGTTLIGTRVSLRFEDFGTVRYARFEDVEDIRHTFYPRHFEDRLIYIPNKKVRKALMLDDYYDVETNPSFFESMAKSKPEEIREKLDKLPEDLKISFATYFIDGIKANKADFLDNNKQAVLNNYFNINVQQMIN